MWQSMMRLDRMRHDGLRLLVDPPKIATICFPSRPTAGLECGPKIKRMTCNLAAQSTPENQTTKSQNILASEF